MTPSSPPSYTFLDTTPASPILHHILNAKTQQPHIQTQPNSNQQPNNPLPNTGPPMQAQQPQNHTGPSTNAHELPIHNPTTHPPYDPPTNHSSHVPEPTRTHRMVTRSQAGITLLGFLFKHKFHADGMLSRYKARLVANGSSQQLGVDFDETFSPVVKPATIRTVLSLAVSRRWPIHQLDVKNAFLNGDLSETVYMHQPPGFVDSRYPHHVCLLQRSLYGLKQAPRAWFQRFAGYVTRARFSPSRCDSSLFIYTQGSQVAYLLIYVDDIILIASSSILLRQIINSLHKEFDITDLGALNYFLGIFVVHHSTGLFLSQKKYALQLLERAHMVNCNLAWTLVDTDSKLGPDVQQICLYMHNPREPYFAALKRIMRYVQGTLDLGLHLYASATTSLVGYTDADWAGCPSTRRSTFGVANVVAETAWIRNLLRELHSPLLTATLVYCDNVSAVYMSANPVQHQRTKHIEIDIHFVRDMVKTGHVRILHVPSRFQYADIFTKGLPSALFEDFRSSLSVRPPLAQTAGAY
ncbi:ribonuclease H-like domain-containing protein [Tanacetum coccineum]